MRLGSLNMFIFRVRFLILSLEKLRMLLINEERRLLFLFMVFIIVCWLLFSFVFNRMEVRVIRECIGVFILWFIIVKKLLWVVIVFFVFIFVIWRVKFWDNSWFCVFIDFFNIVVWESVIVIWVILLIMVFR